MHPAKNNLPVPSNQNYHQDMIEVQRSLNRIESAVMDLRSIILRRNRNTSNTRSTNRDRSVHASTSVPVYNHRTHLQQTAPTSVPRTSRPRQLLQDIANRPNKNTVCWYHKRFGISAHPGNCPTGCTFLAPPNLLEIRNTRRQSSVPRQPMANPIPPATVVPIIPNAQIATTSDSENMAMDQIENDLLNLSDSD